jgi:hypothetical protein
MPTPAQVSGQIAQRLENLRQNRAHDKTTDSAHSHNLPANLLPHWVCAFIGSMNYVTPKLSTQPGRAC